MLFKNIVSVSFDRCVGIILGFAKVYGISALVLGLIGLFAGGLLQMIGR